MKMTEQDDESRSRLLTRYDILREKRDSRKKQEKDREKKWWGRWLNRLRGKNSWRYFIHTAHGAGAAWALFIFPFVGIGWLILIITYQYLEEWGIEDKSYIDMRGYMIGYVVVGVIGMLWHYKILQFLARAIFG
jgi:hypothetical protein